MKQYRTPTIDEFVPGFQYEINLESSQWVEFDFSNSTSKELTSVVEQWDRRTVPEFTSGLHTEQYGEITLTTVKSPEVDKKFYFNQIETYLKNNQIRVEI